jgi:DNA-binding LacI/PurR family transcriptional regulator
MITRPWWQHSPTIHSLLGEGVRNVVHAMMRLPLGDRPDGLIISDDNQVEDATAGLLGAGVRVPEDLKVVAHTNFPWPTEAYVPVIRVGFSTTEIVHACVDLIDRQRRGQSVPRLTTIPAAVAPDE